MTVAGLGLNKFCYIIKFVEQSIEWTSVEASSALAENLMIGVAEEELYNLPTVEYVHRRGGFLNRQLTVYHVAFHTCADLGNVEAIVCLLFYCYFVIYFMFFCFLLFLDIIEGNSKDEKYPDIFIVMQIMRCYLRARDIDNALKTFVDHMNAKKPAVPELYVTLIEGATIGHTPKGMQLAQDTLVKMTERDFFFSSKMGSDLLLIASGEKTGGYTTANYIWDLMQARKITPSLPTVEAYYNGLKGHEILEDDPWLLQVS
ncbi:hypothetical protein FEM48_Zijuj07G0082800 [Ziziphus jujuba var. spinosa]|uniref:Pentatricopeptide repeat-containing protein At4g35850, mitochondrial-like n=1 Tax=Ziziphus jujuba var. spinosa TaxID=714518 RepID=A0A978V3I4_ZIZJJ|nr:hypothetical protein FEM48_Zijuj07G0082800 [Ziziphus jujuba var. spinosa]